MAYFVISAYLILDATSRTVQFTLTVHKNRVVTNTTPSVTLRMVYSLNSFGSATLQSTNINRITTGTQNESQLWCLSDKERDH